MSHGAGAQAYPGRDIGRAAGEPGQIPGAGWKQILSRVRRRTSANNLSLIAAGVAFYGLLALFPALAALIGVYGLMSDPDQVSEQFANMRSVLPSEAYQLISGQLQHLASRSGGALGIGVVGGLLLSIWSATRGTKSMITALNIVYEETEKRGFFKLTLFAFGITLLLVLLGVIAIGLIVALPVALEFLGLGTFTETLVQLVRWPLLAAVALTMMAVLYRYGPSRNNARWDWVSWGSVLAVLLWLLASALFSVYVSQFGSYNATYGSVGAVVVLLMWLFITALVVLIGAEINAEMERQTARDTTVHDGEKPAGRRGAYVADHLPEE